MQPSECSPARCRANRCTLPHGEIVNPGDLWICSSWGQYRNHSELPGIPNYPELPYFSPKKNVAYEVFQFRQATQQMGETIDQFSTRLRKLAANWSFMMLRKRSIKATMIPWQNCHSKRMLSEKISHSLT